ncbi:hypothetical protein [Neobacillus niacini]|uniref:hypothetical protein n=1 Tax=Neobacillus niacini TaxID=86668 RepID=UPI0030005376
MRRNKLMLNFITLLMLTFSLLVGCSDVEKTEGKSELVNLSVERTGNLLTGIGKVKVYIDGEEVMKVKNNQIESVELNLPLGIHTIQTKGQGDKSNKLEFEVLEGQVNTFTYLTEISNIYGVKLEQIR